MNLRNICLAIFGIVLISLIMLTGGLHTVIEAAESDDVLTVDGIDPTDMSNYYAMGEYYPPDDVTELNVNWVGGRVEIVGYNGNDYFVEEAATRQLMEEERLSYVLDGNTFSVFYLGNDQTIIDDAFKKIEIRIPNSVAKNLKSVNVNTNGEVVFKNFTSESISVNNINSSVRFENAYAKSTEILTEGGNVVLKVSNEIGYSVDFKSKTGIMNSYIDNGKNSYISGIGTYSYSVETRTGDLSVELLREN